MADEQREKHTEDVDVRVGRNSDGDLIMVAAEGSAGVGVADAWVDADGHPSCFRDLTITVTASVPPMPVEDAIDLPIPDGASSATVDADTHETSTA